MRHLVPPRLAPSALGMVQQYNGTAAWRIIWPMDYLHRMGYRTTWGFNGERETSAAAADADVIVMHRLAWKPEDSFRGVLWRRLLHEDGKVLVYDHDDDLITESIIDRVQQTLPPNITKSREDIDLERRCHLFSISLCDGVICSTPYLASMTAPLTDKPIIVVPNAIDLARFRATLGRRDPSRPITIGWIGGNRPSTDAEALATAWTVIARRYPTVRFRVAYYQFSALLQSVPPDRIEYVPPRPIDTYPASFNSLDIGCAPLNDEPFNRSKSPIKAFEYAAAGAAVCASPVVYPSVIRHGENGLICSSVDEWVGALALLIEQPDLRRHLASTLLSEVESRYQLSVNAHAWPEAWSRIIANFRLGQFNDLPRRSYDVPAAAAAD